MFAYAVIRTHYFFLMLVLFLVDSCFLTVSITFVSGISLCKPTENLKPMAAFHITTVSYRKEYLLATSKFQPCILGEVDL